MVHPLVEQLRFTRSEWLRALRGVSEEDGSKHLGPMNSISWIVGHLGWQEQRYFLTRLSGTTPVPELNVIAPNGGRMTTPSLEAMLADWRVVTRAVDGVLEPLHDTDMTKPLGDAPRLIGNAVQRVTYHYWFHIGEILAIRQLLDHPRRPEFVGNIDDRAPYRARGAEPEA
jgi:DinB superfamily